MGKRGKLQSKHDDDDNEQASKFAFKFVCSDDDEGNEDLSSKIVEKALTRSMNTKNQMDESEISVVDVNGSRTNATDVNSSSSREIEEVADLSGEAYADVIPVSISEKKSKKERREKKRKDKKIAFEEKLIDSLKEEEQAETVKIDSLKEEEQAKTVKTMEIAEPIESNPLEPSSNIVLRNLLRIPRYFDPPDSHWRSTCFNCDEEGHAAVNCTKPKRKKPCFVCGSMEHGFKQCTKGLECFICKKEGHRAKDCLEKYNDVSRSSKMCLVCGHSGHDMFSCRNDYSSEDLKEIQCYVCKSVGHLCCASSIGDSPREVSCYKCGHQGHAGSACGRSHVESSELGTPSSCFRCGEGGHFARECTSSIKARGKSRAENEMVTPPGSCFKCGEDGHFARECTTSTKVKKRSREYSTPSQPVKKDKSYYGFNSEPHNLGKPRKSKKPIFEVHYQDRSNTTPHKAKHRGGWVTEDPGDWKKPKENNWKYSATPIKKNHSFSPYSYGGEYSDSRSYNANSYGGYSGASAYSQGSAQRHKYSASRFGNGSNNGWW